MVYAYDKWEGLPVMQLYDTDIMKMSIAAAKDMYEKGQQQIKDFSTTYGDFVTPIQRDQDWYNQNVTGKFRRAIDDLYAKGIDPIRSAEGRMLLSRIANSVDVGQVAKLRTSADNAREFLKARKQLEAAGLYNPLLAKYDGPDINSYSTLESGAWDKMSPTKIVDMATFGNPYFEGMKPNVHKASKKGVSYSIEKIDENDLRNIADAHYNELVSTPQGQLMYRYYVDMAGGDHDMARQMFNNAIVDGQRRRIYQKDDFDDQWDKHQQIAQGWARINQAKREFEFQKQVYEDSKNPRETPPIGAADQVSLDQKKQYVQNEEEYGKSLDNAEASARKKLTSEGQKKLMKLYKEDLKTINDKTSSKDAISKAEARKKRIENNYGKAVSDWALAYEQSSNKTESWLNYNKNYAKDGEDQPENQLRSKSHNIFMRNNVIRGAIDDGVKQDMNHALGIRKDGDKNIGVVKQGTAFAPITEASVTGTRTYKYNSIYKKLNRALQGKDYEMSEKNMSGMLYGNGNTGSADVDMIYHVGKFSYNDLKDILGSYDNAKLEAMGILRDGDSENSDYIIPMITSFSSGSQTWANINTETDKRIDGASGAQKHRPTRQASAVLKPIQ